jgi:hypothetical protein
LPYPIMDSLSDGMSPSLTWYPLTAFALLQKAQDYLLNIIIPIFMIQQTIIRVCRTTNNYFVVLMHTSVSSFLLQGFDR